MSRFMILLASVALFAGACGNDTAGPTLDDTTTPTVLSVNLANAGADIVQNGTVSAVFSEAMAHATINTTANFKGVILSHTLISMNTGPSSRAEPWPRRRKL
jgi:hypothetical protein